jgi:hypothetical protein
MKITATLHLAQSCIGGLQLRAVVGMLRHQLAEVGPLVEAQLARRLHRQPQELLLLLWGLLCRGRGLRQSLEPAMLEHRDRFQLANTLPKATEHPAKHA